MHDGAQDGALGAEEPGGALARRITRATIAVALITLSARALGLVEKIVVANYFGADARVDAYTTALTFAFGIYLFVREVVEPAFLPLFVQGVRRGDEDRAWQLVAFVATVVLAGTAAVAVAVELGADGLAARLAPGFDAQGHARLAGLLRWMAPGTVLLALSSLSYLVLNGYRRFALPEVAHLAYKAGPAAACVLLVGRFGVTSLAIGFVVGCAARLAVHVGGLLPRLARLRWPEGDAVRDVGSAARLALPVVAGSLFTLASDLFDNYFASLLGEGGVAARSYAKRLKDVPVEVVPHALGIVLLPYFALLAAGGETQRLYALLGRTVRGLAVFFGGVAVCTVLLAEPLVSVVLERGAFDARARVLSAWPLQMYGLGMVTFAVEVVIVNFYFALKDTWTPVVLGVAGVLLNVALTWLLIGPLGVGGVALAQTLSKTAKVAALAWLLRRKRAELDFAAAGRSALVLVAAAAVSAAALAGFLALWQAPLESLAWGRRAALVAGGGTLGMTAFLATAALLGRGERGAIAATFGWVARALGRGEAP